MCSPDDYKHLWLEPTHHARYVDPADKNYELDLWHQWYLPPDGVEGKTVVDMGAGCGETAQFYLLHGAKHVIAIESETHFVDFLKHNFAQDPRVTIVQAHIDMVKMDIEGGEKNMLVETHFVPYWKPLGVVGRGRIGPAELWRLEKHRHMSRLSGWIHMRRIGWIHAFKLLFRNI